MATEIAVAYVSIVPETSKVAPGVRRSLGAVERDAAASGQRMGASLGRSLSSAMSTVTVGVLGIGAAIGGLALKGGFDRALAIDNAQAKMKGLRYSSEQITAVMGQALDAVKGTAFGLGDAASLATQLLAAGIKPGQDLSRALGNVADLAAVANVSLADLSPVMGQLASSSHLYTQDLLQLQQRGLPVFGWLAESLGTTQDQVREMVTEGKISFTDLQAAIEQHVGGAAKKIDSFSASWSNLKAAMSRGGALIATPALQSLKGVFDDMIPAVDAVSAALEPIITALAGRLAPAIASVSERMAAWLSSVDLGDIGLGLKNMSAALLPLGGLLAALGGQGLKSILGPLGAFIPAISGPMGLIAGAIAGLVAASPALRSALGGAFSAIGDALKGLLPALKPLGQLVQQLAESLGGALASAINAIVPIITNLINAIGPVLTSTLAKLMPVITQLVDVLAQVVTQVIAALAPAIDDIIPVITELASVFADLVSDALSELLPVIQDLVPTIVDVAEAFAQLLTDSLDALVPVLVDLAQTVFPILVDIVKQLAPVVVQVVEALLPLVPLVAQLLAELLPPLAEIIKVVAQVVAELAPLVIQLVQAFLPLLPPLVDLVGALLPPLSALLSALSPIIQAVATVLGALLKAIIPVVTWIAEKLVGALSSLITWVASAYEGIASFVKNGIEKIGEFAKTVGEKVQGVIDWFKDIPGKIKDVFKNAGKWLVDAGKKILEGLLSGLKSAWKKVTDFVGGIGSWIKDHKGPPEYDATLLVNNGRLIMQSLQDGFELEAPNIEKYLSNFGGSLGVNVNADAAPQAGSNDVYVDKIEISAKDVAEFVTVVEFMSSIRNRAQRAVGVSV